MNVCTCVVTGCVCVWGGGGGGGGVVNINKSCFHMLHTNYDQRS